MVTQVAYSKKLKVLLISPNHAEWTNVLPLGIAYVAAVLRNKDCQVSVIDASVSGLSPLQIAKKIRIIEPDIVGVGASTVQIYASWEILKQAKIINAGIVTILGGVHPSALPEESLEHNFVDFVCRGESEETIVELIDALYMQGSIKEVAGLSYKENGKVIHNSPRRLISDLDKLPFPARDLFPFPQKYSSPYLLKRRYANLITSRGCPGSCIFCNKNIFGSLFRPRSAKNVLDEIEYLVKTYGIEEFHISDDCFACDRERVFNICELILKKGLKITWACQNGLTVNQCSQEIFEIMKKAGCYRVAIGIESGDEEILKKMGKAINLEQARVAFENAQRAGLLTLALFMLGNYGENEETMLKTIDFAKSLKTDYAQFNITVPYPGTPLFKLIERDGKILTRDWSRFGILDDQLVFETAEIKNDLLLKMRKKAYWEFYFRLSQLFFIFKKRARYYSIRELRLIFASAKKVVTRRFAKHRIGF